MYGIAPVTHGVTDQTAELRGIRLTETSHSPNARIVRHRHAYPAITLVLSGGFLEDFGAGHTHECGAMSVLVKPADAPHSNRYSRLVTLSRGHAVANAPSLVVHSTGGDVLFTRRP